MHHYYVMWLHYCRFGNAQCLEDEPDDNAALADPTELVGITFDADAQCKASFRPNEVFCAPALDVSWVCFFTLLKNLCLGLIIVCWQIYMM